LYGRGPGGLENRGCCLNILGVPPPPLPPHGATVSGNPSTGSSRYFLGAEKEERGRGGGGGRGEESQPLGLIFVQASDAVMRGGGGVPANDVQYLLDLGAGGEGKKRERKVSRSNLISSPLPSVKRQVECHVIPLSLRKKEGEEKRKKKKKRGFAIPPFHHTSDHGLQSEKARPGKAQLRRL